MNVARSSSSSFAYGNDILFWAIFHILYVIWILWNCKMVNQWTVQGYIMYVSYSGVLIERVEGFLMILDRVEGYVFSMTWGEWWWNWKVFEFDVIVELTVFSLFNINVYSFKRCKTFLCRLRYKNIIPIFMHGKFCLENIMCNGIFCTTGTEHLLSGLWAWNNIWSWLVLILIAFVGRQLALFILLWMTKEVKVNIHWIGCVSININNREYLMRLQLKFISLIQISQIIVL